MNVINIADHRGRKAEPPKPRPRRPVVEYGQYGLAGALTTAEDKSFYAELRTKLAGELRPAGFLEEQIVQMICDSEFRLARMERIAQTLMAQQRAGKTVPETTLDSLARHQGHLQKMVARARVELGRQQKWRKKTRISKVD
jgi:hypothetical protein